MLHLQAILAALGRLTTLEIVGLQSLALLLFVWLVAKIYRRRADESAAKPLAASMSPINETPRTEPGAEASSAAAAMSAAVEMLEPHGSAEPEIPEDSVLHRHYLANREAERLAISDPYPSDSVLHRHYDAAHCYHHEQPAAPAPIVKSACGCQGACAEAKPVIPQDSVLRRHFTAQLQAEIESRFSTVPSDSVLRRHHRAMVAAELQARLSAFQG